MRTDFCYRAAYADYAAFLGDRQFDVARTSSCLQTIQARHTTRTRLLYLPTRNYAATVPCRPAKGDASTCAASLPSLPLHTYNNAAHLDPKPLTLNSSFHFLFHYPNIAPIEPLFTKGELWEGRGLLVDRNYSTQGLGCFREYVET